MAVISNQAVVLADNMYQEYLSDRPENVNIHCWKSQYNDISTLFSILYGLIHDVSKIANELDKEVELFKGGVV